MGSNLVANQNGVCQTRWFVFSVVDQFGFVAIAGLEPRHEELLHLGQHVFTGVRVIDGGAKPCTARHSVRKPRGKLLHLAHRVAHARIAQADRE